MLLCLYFCATFPVLNEQRFKLSWIILVALSPKLCSIPQWHWGTNGRTALSLWLLHLEAFKAEAIPFRVLCMLWWEFYCERYHRHPNSDSATMLFRCGWTALGHMWTWWSAVLSYGGAQATVWGCYCGIFIAQRIPSFPLVCPCQTKLTWCFFLTAPSSFAVLLQIKGLGCMWRLSANE